ncbi:MAG: hypothetical protein ACAI25_11985 [Planctomycetota bacterium]
MKRVALAFGLALGLSIAGQLRSEESALPVEEKVLLEVPAKTKGYPLFEPSGKSAAFVVAHGAEHAVSFAGKEGPRYRGIVSPVAFAPDGKSVAYAALTARKYVLVHGERVIDKYDDVGAPVFLADGTLVFRAKRGGKHFVVVGETEGPPFGDVGLLTRTRGGEHVYYVAGPKNRLVVSGSGATGASQGEEFDWIDPPLETKGGLVYRANRGGAFEEGSVNIPPYGGEWFVVANGKKSAAYERVEHLAVGADGRVSFAGWRGGKATWVTIKAF